eukprot:scaffold112775_cov36-Phaeocystis_antarctica.AAC.1
MDKVPHDMADVTRDDERGGCAVAPSPTLSSRTMPPKRAASQETQAETQAVNKRVRLRPRVRLRLRLRLRLRVRVSGQGQGQGQWSEGR